MEQFEIKAKMMHGNRYDYSLVNYVNAKTKVKIVCHEHGVFEQMPYNHLMGKGCALCGGASKHTIDTILPIFLEMHGDRYDYSLIQAINGVFNKVNIICRQHGIFSQTVKAHSDGKGCPKCAGKNLSREELLCKLRLVHGEKYDYTNSTFQRANDKVIIGCDIHGDFEQTLYSHKAGQGCPRCQKSKGESSVRKCLVNLGIGFEEQKTFSDCINPKTNKQLLFDFFLPAHNLCIEYDGEQHFKPFRFSRKNNHNRLVQAQERDALKDAYCKKNGISLLRINYKQLSSISALIGSTLSVVT